MKLYLERRCGTAARVGPYLRTRISVRLGGRAAGGGGRDEDAPNGVVVELEQGNSDELHILGNREDLCKDVELCRRTRE